MLDPPGTIRTPLAAVKDLTGKVALSKKGCRTGSTDMSTTAPIRNPSRIPFLTQPFTRQPLLADVSGSAARARPAFNVGWQHGLLRQVPALRVQRGFWPGSPAWEAPGAAARLAPVIPSGPSRP